MSQLDWNHADGPREPESFLVAQLNPGGRIGRGEYVARAGGVVLALVLGLFLVDVVGGPSPILWVFAAILGWVSTLSLLAKRLRDAGLPPVLALLPVAAVLGRILGPELSAVLSLASLGLWIAAAVLPTSARVDATVKLAL